MGFYPTVKAPETQRLDTDVFFGYDHREKIPEGAWYDMKNLTGEAYPLLSVRKKRGRVKTLQAPQGLAGRDTPLWIDGTELWMGGVNVTPYLTAKGVMLTQGDTVCGKQLVSMGAYVCIFPDKVYVNTQDYDDCGYMEAAWRAGETEVTFSLCDDGGAACVPDFVQGQEPAEPENGQWWIDTSASPHSLRQYSAAMGQWTAAASACVKLEAPGIGAAFGEGDGIFVSGCSVTEGSASLGEQTAALNTLHCIRKRGENFVVIPGILDAVCRQTGGVVLERRVPEMDHVCQAGNRLWGCRYGLAEGKTVNELYCCKLGDFRNWNVFEGLSTDAWAASVGSDGVFTGAVNFLGSLVFFKETVLHRVTISPYGGHSVAETACRGIQKGCHKSAAMVGELLYYKARDGICVYDGALPVLISQPLGEVRYDDAAAGAFGERYFCSMRDERGARHLFVYDGARQLWFREDGLSGAAFARTEKELWCIDGSTGELLAMTGTQGEAETDVEWEAVSGRLGYEYPGRKYLNRLELRLKAEKESRFSVEVQYDSNGVWEEQVVCIPERNGVVTVPLRPRRCDHFALRLKGAGNAVLFRLSRVLEGGRI